MKAIICLSFLLLLIQCNEKPKVPEHFDFSKWAADPNGCKGIRSKVLADFFPYKAQLIGKTENEILGLMGKPNRVQLYQRNQKFYFYSLKGNTLCADSTLEVSEFYLRFSATFQVTEVNYTQD
jgi:hypothetical protein